MSLPITLNATPSDTLGITAITIEYSTGGRDHATITCEGRAANDAALFPHLTGVTIAQDGVTLFSGLSIRPKIIDRPNAPAHIYTIENPWWYAEHIPFLQTWKKHTIADDTATPTTPGLTRAILGQSTTGTPETSATVLTAALTRASDSGSRFLLGTISPSITPPWEETTDLTCAEVVRRLLRWSPNHVIHWDYTTTPPTLHIVNPSTLPANDIPYGDNGSATEASIQPRPDLIPTGVVIRYERSNSTSGGTYETVEYDTWPAALDPETNSPQVIHWTIALAGRNTTRTSQRIETQDYPADFTTDKAWWKARIPWLNAHPDANITLTNFSRSGAQNHPGELIEGTIAPFMTSNPDRVETETFRIQAVITQTLGNDIVTELDAAVTSTDFNTGTYSDISGDAQEATPSGIAQSVYTAMQAFGWEGTITTEAPSVPATNPVAQRLNLPDAGTILGVSATGPHIIRSATSDLYTGRVTHLLGAPSHLTAQDYLELQRSNRVRTTVTHSKTRVTGETKDNGLAVDQGGPIPRQNTAASPPPRMPDGTIDRQTLIWDDTNKKWEPGPILPEGAPGDLLTYDEGGDLILISNPGAPSGDDWIFRHDGTTPYWSVPELPSGGSDGDILSRASGAPIWETPGAGCGS